MLENRILSVDLAKQEHEREIAIQEFELELNDIDFSMFYEVVMRTVGQRTLEEQSQLLGGLNNQLEKQLAIEENVKSKTKRKLL